MLASPGHRFLSQKWTSLFKDNETRRKLNKGDRMQKKPICTETHAALVGINIYLYVIGDMYSQLIYISFPIL